MRSIAGVGMTPPKVLVDAIPLVVGHDQEHVGRTFRWHHRRGPPWLGIRGGIFDHSTELRIRRRKLFAAYGRGRVRRTWRTGGLDLCWGRRRSRHDGEPRTLRWIYVCFSWFCFSVVLTSLFYEGRSEARRRQARHRAVFHCSCWLSWLFCLFSVLLLQGVLLRSRRLADCL